MVKRSTSTSAFGVSKRESHDASGFYRRFTPPDLSSDTEVAPYRALDKLIVGDARRMDEVPDSSVALVVTSPPYFAGKEYEAVSYTHLLLVWTVLSLGAAVPKLLVRTISC